MQAKEAAERLEITPRMLRHYEKEGLLTVDRTLNGYRHYNAADLRRAGRIRDLIASGFSTREIRGMSACLSDDGSGPCEGGVEMLKQKLANIDRLRDDLTRRRATVLDRLEVLEQSLARKAALAERITEDSQV
ncbi:MerR family transcriptional regulator [Sulfitobacter mediterraneus]|jgi:MerR family transcriptional regulator, copper efflux regulator|uniref:MerR family transcriptional regulator n=1 Tax=Sulfitobacter mediterraneus TaxID=83219 RepID=UPI0019319C30|nr:MerR family transcriptional regulator [Sulfitobacter mediterraneus]MBM1631913.1 MerR family transcriptional regulator [Sulfitobacter mediterraneus]MBM1639728.1 MerR family transcriptional regulator [Sulfitobacter mediterraneus]MBM1643777.1 MerR family transcriptional regulator [Sulfitobacter mediterraneus]MBM1647823.1 MerR family transcriptional regulator [Sulfitobacter mediterraneus]MBM1651868.1 MerR family transcriptional regulator [Sulfitobacter mediterraneus]